MSHPQTGPCVEGLAQVLALNHGSFSVPPPSVASFRVAYGYLEGARRFAAAGMGLVNQGQAMEAQSLARQSMECAVRGHWVMAKGEDAVAVVTFDHFQSVKKIGEAASRSGLTLTGAQDLGSLPPRPGRLLGQWQNFEQVCQSMGNEGKQLYVWFRIMSQFVHPSLGMSASYLPEDPEQVAVLDVPRGPFLDAVPQSLVHSTFYATRTLDDVHAEHPHAGALDEIGQRLGLLTRLPVPS